MPDSRSKCLQTCRIHHQVKYWRLDANTSIVAAILFSGHPYIGRHYRASLIIAPSHMSCGIQHVVVHSHGPL